MVKAIFPQNNENIQEDIRRKLMVNYYRKEYTEGDKSDWRVEFLQIAHYVPLICLGTDMFFNKIKMRFMHIFHLMIIVSLYLLNSLLVSFYAGDDLGPYYDNLRWFCKNNWYYQYDAYGSTEGTIYA